MVASTRTATARPVPIIFTATESSIAKPAKTATMITAAELITLAVEDDPATTLPLTSWLRSHSSLIRPSRNTS